MFADITTIAEIGAIGVNLVVVGAGVVGFSNTLTTTMSASTIPVGKNLCSLALVVLCTHELSIMRLCCGVNRVAENTTILFSETISTQTSVYRILD